ncbi:MAG: class A beta-lactamase [Chthoniobacterales bacterium]|nr:class A beta-lactamase [Chthoniobacterales bacterium]
MQSRMLLSSLAGTALLAAGVAGGQADARIAALEARMGGRTGVAALDTQSGRRIEHRSNERFRLCSTFKLLAAAAILRRVEEGTEDLERFVPYEKKELLDYAPITKEHLKDGGMKLGDLCAAAIEVSDNTAGNLLLRALGGPAGLTKFLRTIGDPITRLDRMEPELNRGAPGDKRDTTTPAAMQANLERLLTGELLTSASRSQLESWLAATTTGSALIREGVPADWPVGDKTGRSADGAVNDIAILHPPGRAPIFLAIYTVAPAAAGEAQNKIVAEVARVVAESFSRDR